MRVLLELLNLSKHSGSRPSAGGHLKYFPMRHAAIPMSRTFRPNARAGAVASLAVKVATLKSSDAYSDPTRVVQAVETHMSWVFLTDAYAYKLKKPVRYAFLDFRALSARRLYCETEVRLNRRLAGDVYLGVVPLVRDARGLMRVGGRGRVVDWLVKMRRLPADRVLSRMVATDTIDKTALARAASLLAGFYRDAPPIRIAPSEYRERLRRDLNQTFRELRKPRYRLSLRRLDRLATALSGYLKRSGNLIEQRARGRRIVEGHGDLRPDHVFLTKPAPVIIDCLEFNRSFRIVDPVDELAYLGMECERLGSAAVGDRFLETYRRVTGDRPPPSLMAFYRGCRACQRAKLAVWHTKEPNSAGPTHWLGLARVYLRLAERYLADLS